MRISDSPQGNGCSPSIRDRRDAGPTCTLTCHQRRTARLGCPEIPKDARLPLIVQWKNACYLEVRDRETLVLR